MLSRLIGGNKMVFLPLLLVVVVVAGEDGGQVVDGEMEVGGSQGEGSLDRAAGSESEALLRGDPVPLERSSRPPVSHENLPVMSGQQAPLWPDNTVLYAYGDDIIDRNSVGWTMGQYEQLTCLQFSEVSLTSNLRHVVISHSPDTCETTVLKNANPRIFLTPQCAQSHRTVLRELGHTLGLVATHARPDRDDHLKVHLENVPAEKHARYASHPTANTYGTEYDYTSVMHYGPTIGNKEGKIVLEATHPAGAFLIGRFSILSHWDMLALNRAYKCYVASAAKCGHPADLCNNGLLEFSAQTNNCWCTCQVGTHGPTCASQDDDYLKAIMTREYPRVNTFVKPKGWVSKTVPPSNQADSRWIIQAPTCHNIVLKFQQFDLGGCPSSTSNLYFNEYDDEGKQTNYANIFCPPSPTLNKDLTFYNTKVEVVYQKLNGNAGEDSDGIEFTYEFQKAENCSSACLPGACPKPVTTEAMTLEQVSYFYDQMTTKYPLNAKVIKYGTTKGGNDLHVVLVRPYIKPNVRNARHNPNRKSVWVEAAFQAGHPVSLEACLKYIEELLKKPCAGCTKDYYFQCMVNPDGYAYALKNNIHNYTKNTEVTNTKKGDKQGGVACKGVNIYYNFKKSATEGDTNPCSDTYQGTSEMSTVETRYYTNIKKNLKNIALTVLLSQTTQVTSEGSITVADNTPNSADMATAEAFMRGVHKETPGCNYTINNLKDEKLRSVQQYSQENFGNTIRISFPTFSQSELSRTKKTVNEFINGMKQMTDHVSGKSKGGKKVRSGH